MASTTKQRMDFGSQAEWEAYLREQPVPPLGQVGYFRKIFEEERAIARIQGELDRQPMPSYDLLLSPASSKKCPGLPPTQMRLDLRQPGQVPSHASPDVVKSDYLSEIMSPIGLQKTVRKVCRIIRTSGVKFDAVAFRGFSGAIIAPMVACRMKKGFLAVRKSKEYEACHSSQLVEGAVKVDCRYIIVDDLISSGATIWNIVETLKNYIYQEFDTSGNAIPHTHKRECVGVFLYNSWITDEKAESPGYDVDEREIYSPFEPYSNRSETSFFVRVWSFRSK